MRLHSASLEKNGVHFQLFINAPLLPIVILNEVNGPSSDSSQSLAIQDRMSLHLTSVPGNPPAPFMDGFDRLDL